MEFLQNLIQTVSVNDKAEMLASGVEIKSTDTLFFAKMSNTFIRKPEMLIMRGEKMFISTIPSLKDMDLTPSSTVS